MRKEIEVLEHHPYLLANFNDVDFRIGNIIFIHDDMTICDFLEFIQASQEGVFSRARRTYDTDHFLLFHLCTDIFNASSSPDDFLRLLTWSSQFISPLYKVAEFGKQVNQDEVHNIPHIVKGPSMDGLSLNWRTSLMPTSSLISSAWSSPVVPILTATTFTF